MNNELPPKPPCPPGRDIHEFWGETKASKSRRKKYEEDHKEWKKKVKNYQKRAMTTIERIEKGIR